MKNNKKTFIRLFCFVLLVFPFSNLLSSEPINIILEAENPILQQGSQGKDEKSAASGGEVLGAKLVQVNLNQIFKPHGSICKIEPAGSKIEPTEIRRCFEE